MKTTNHQNRRQMLRQQFLVQPSNKSEEELLELLLSYAIPIGDHQPLAKTLLKKYGTLENVLNAEHEDLCKIKGIKNNTAILLKLVSNLRPSSVPIKKTFPVAQKKPASSGQIQLYNDDEELSGEPSKGVNDRQVEYTRESLFFSKALVKDTIQVIPTLPKEKSVEDLRNYLIENLKYGAESSRRRYSQYILRRMFPSGQVDQYLLDFARKYPQTQILNDIVFYRFCKAEPIMRKIVSELLIPMTSTGSIDRSLITQYLSERYPTIKNINDWSVSIVEALAGARIVSADKKKLTLSFRKPLIQSFAFVLHNEYPSPGVYSLDSIKINLNIKAMMWYSDSMVPMLYELRNQGLITRVSEIDSVRQFTTKYTPESLIAHLPEVSK